MDETFSYTMWWSVYRRLWKFSQPCSHHCWIWDK
ncbi:hypothetical protein Gotur_017026 [Gossypium turneri]